MTGARNGKSDGSLHFVCTLCDGAEAQFESYGDVTGHVREVHKVSAEAVNSVIKAPGPEGLKSYRCILCSEFFPGKATFCRRKY